MNGDLANTNGEWTVTWGVNILGISVENHMKHIKDDLLSVVREREKHVKQNEEISQMVKGWKLDISITKMIHVV